MLDIIGKIYNIDATDQDNPVATELDGWHVNSSEPLPDLDQYRVYPVTPRRVFMGTDTVYCYQFESESQANELLNLTADGD